MPGCPSASSSHLYDEVAPTRVSTHHEGFPLAAVGTWAPSSGGQEPRYHFSLVFPLKQPSALSTAFSLSEALLCWALGQMVQHTQVKGGVTSGRQEGASLMQQCVGRLLGASFLV